MDDQFGTHRAFPLLDALTIDHRVTHLTMTSDQFQQIARRARRGETRTVDSAGGSTERICTTGTSPCGPPISQGRWAVDLSVSGDRPVWAGDRRVGCLEAGAGGDPTILLFTRALEHGPSPTEVVTGKAAVYPPVLEEITLGS